VYNNNRDSRDSWACQNSARHLASLSSLIVIDKFACVGYATDLAILFITVKKSVNCLISSNYFSFSMLMYVALKFLEACQSLYMRDLEYTRIWGMEYRISKY